MTSVIIDALSLGVAGAPISDCGVLGNEESVLAESGNEGTMGRVISTDSYVV